MTPEAGERFCKACDYPLAAEGMVACPECGRGFDAGDAGTYSARPTARRRRWMRRGWMALGVIVLIEVFAPSRVARFTWTWPNADGATVTSETRWHLVGPRWLGIAYPRFTVARWTHPDAAGYREVADYRIWRVGWVSVWLEGGVRGSTPPSPGRFRFGCIVNIDTGEIIDIRPGNFDALADVLLFHSSNRLSWSPHVLPTYPPPLMSERE